MLGLDLAGRTVGGHRVETLLGHGAYGWVYRARQVSLDRDVALKVLDPVVARNPEAAARFDREGRSAARLDHPAIVDVYQAGVADGLHYLAMRLVRGPGLDEVLRQGGGRLAVGPALTLLHRIAGALDHAHQRGVIHRDVKPSNILLEDGDPARCWLGDFGIAVTVRAAGPLSTAALGTVAYMAPEQVDPTRIGPAADQYALACVAYRVLTGRLPFDGDDSVGVLLAHAKDPVPGTGSPALDEVFARGMAKQPEHRYPTAGEFVTALERAARQPVEPPTMRISPVAPKRRRWWPVGVGGVVAAIAALVVVLVMELSSPGNDSPAGWQSMAGPGPVHYAVPGDWQRTDTQGLQLTTYSASSGVTLYVGSDTGRFAVNPVMDEKRQYACPNPVSTQIAGHIAAECQTGVQQATVIQDGTRTVRFLFATSVSVGDRDSILNSVRFSG